MIIPLKFFDLLTIEVFVHNCVTMKNLLLEDNILNDYYDEIYKDMDK